ncbi:MAG: glycosyltransferase family 9 protein [Rhabdochlamydiaceae bacterium]|jgi:heptosyltransferase-2
MPNWIGDLVMATPILTDLRKAFPEAHITAMCRAPIAELLEEDYDINELFTFHKINGLGHRAQKRDIVQKIRQGKYDLGILLTNSFSSAWWFWQGKVNRIVGYKGQLRSLF